MAKSGALVTFAWPLFGEALVLFVTDGRMYAIADVDSPDPMGDRFAEAEAAIDAAMAWRFVPGGCPPGWRLADLETLGALQ